MRTGEYEISRTFSERVLDLGCWTMGPGMFKRYPEFRSDIASIDSIPQSVSGSGSLLRQQKTADDEEIRRFWEL